MARAPEPGIPAEYEYQPVKYFPFKVGPAKPLVLTADPWSYLYAWLTQQRPAKGVGRRRYERALYYTGLAEGFYRAAETTQLPTKGTLAYYGMLNLIKCFISVRGVELEQKLEHHGLTLPHRTKSLIQVQDNSPNRVAIFHEFARSLGTPVAATERVSLTEVYSHIPEIHEIAFSLGLLNLTKRKFLPVKINFLVNGKKDRLFTEIRYEKKNDMRADTSNFLQGARAQYFQKREERESWIVFRSKGRNRVTNTSFPRIYINILRRYTKFNIAAILTRDGYRYYCDLLPGHFHHLCYTVMAMFYIGSVARYRPTEMREVMESPLRPLLTESVATCPKQFLYQLASLTTNSVCVIPHAKID
jgi:hypothetical protein